MARVARVMPSNAMKPQITSRPFLIVLLETAYFLCVVHFASSPAGSQVPPSVTATALIVGCVLLPIVIAPRRLARFARIVTRVVGGLLLVSGSLALLAGHEPSGGDWSIAALGLAFLCLPLALREEVVA